MSEIHLYTHALMTENIALYRRIGFVETQRVSEKGYERVYMTQTPANRGQFDGNTRDHRRAAEQLRSHRAHRLHGKRRAVHAEPGTAAFARCRCRPSVRQDPAMRHGDVALCETKAICTYIDLAFDGPPLIPRNPTDAARTEQWISLVNTGFDLVFAREYLRRISSRACRTVRRIA